MANAASDSHVHSPCSSVTAVSQCGPVPGTLGSGMCVDHIEKSFLPIVHHSKSHLVFSGFVSLNFTRAVGSVMETITCTDKAWQ